MTIAAKANDAYRRGGKSSPSNEITAIPFSECTPKHPINVALKSKYLRFPRAHLRWAKRLLHNNFQEEGLAFISLALDNAEFNRRPYVVYLVAAQIAGKFGSEDAAHDILDHAINKFPNKLALPTYKATLLMKQQKAEDTILLLRPLWQAGTFNTHLVRIMGRALIQAGRPQEAIELLEPIHKTGSGDEITDSLLAHACVDAIQRKPFARVKACLPKALQDYLEAKLLYRENDPLRALQIAQPYIENSRPSQKIAALYMACVPDHSPLHTVMRRTIGNTAYQRLMISRAKWLEDPLRMEMDDPAFSTALTLYELGGHPVSANERAKAGLDRKVPIASNPAHTLWKPELP